MTLFNLNRDELRKINIDFKRTLIGQSIYGLKLCVQIFFILVLIQEAIAIFSESFNIIVTPILLCALILSVILEYFYLYFLNIYYTSNKKK